MSVSSTPRRVTVVSPRARVDVALPVESTLAELLPQLVSMTGAESSEPGPPGAVTGWALSKLGGVPLEPGHTVIRAGLRDGDVLYLNPRQQRTPPLLFDDVVDAIANAAESRAGSWHHRIARRVALAGALVGVLCFTAVFAFAGPGWPWPALGTGVLAVLLLVAAGALARAYGDAAAGALLAVAGVPAALLAGIELLPGSTFGIGRLSLGLAAMTVYAVLAAVAVADRLAWFVGVAVTGGIGCLSATATVLLGAEPVSTAAVVIALSTALCPALPMVALRLGRLPLPRIPSDVAAFRAEERPTLGPDVIDETAAAEDSLTGLLAAVSVLVAGGAGVLLAGHSRWGWALAATAGLTLVLRSRSYAGTAQRLVLLLAGLGTMIGTGAALAARDASAVRVPLLCLAGLVTVGCMLYASRSSGRDSSPYWSRLLDIAEFLCLISLIPLAAAVLEIYSKVRSLGG